ncbi:TerC family protein [Terrarubrum flagellatum]|uniref:TerC family protein n=1 Tax=Terrirubrum flagellatum TaxID=2895980 RepID=UPI003145393B
MNLSSDILVSVLQIVWIDVLLSGDNAVVIALACRELPAKQRKAGILLGTGAAILLRILFAAVIIYLMKIPLLKLAGGLLLLWIAVKLVVGEEDHREIKASDTMWNAVRTIAIADAVMSLDNVLAVSAAAHGDISLFIFGIVLSIPLIIFGSSVVLALLTRFPILVWFGAALLGWIAGDMISEDPWLTDRIGKPAGLVQYLGDTIGALFVLAAGFFLKWRKERLAHGA